MRGFLIALVGVCFAACGPEAPAGDAGPGARITVEVVDSTPCEDWAPVTHPAPELPPDAPAVPTVIWEWAPLDDPMLSGLSPGSGPYEIRNFAISPSGIVWMYGPTNTDLTAVSRDGVALYHERFDDPAEHRIAIGPIAAAPDDTVFVGVGGDYSWIGHFSLGGRLDSLPMTGPSMGGRRTVIGPGGHVYVGADEMCRLDRVTRRIRSELVLSDGTVTRGGVSQIGADGSIVVGFLQGTLEWWPSLMPSGETTWRLGTETTRLDGDWRFAVGARAAGRDLISSGDVVRNRGYTRVTAGEAEVVAEFRSDSTVVVLDPMGELWLFDPTEATMERRGVWPARPAPCRPAFDHFVFADDGTVICSADGRLLAISAADGELLWELRPEAGGADSWFGFFAGPDLDGRLYVTGRRATDPVGSSPSLFALQTNLRPPGGEFCHSDGCNRHRSRWARDYRPR